MGKKEDFTEVDFKDLKLLGVEVLTALPPSSALHRVLTHSMTSLKAPCSRPLEVNGSPDWKACSGFL